MFWTEQKLAARIKELDSYRYREKISIPSFQFQLDSEGTVGAYPPRDRNGTTKRLGETWAGRDLYAWLMTEVVIPKEWSGETVIGFFDFGITDGGHNSGFESLLFVNGQPYQGVDANHKEVFFPKELAGTTVQLTFRLWSGLEGGGVPKEQIHILKQAEIACLDLAVDDLYFTSKAVLQAVGVMDNNRPEREELLIKVNKAFHQLDWTNPGSVEFYDSLHRAQHQLKRGMEKMGKHHSVTIHAVGHTHIDVAWLWRLKHTREKAARSFSTVLRLMERYPEYYFQQAQPQLYEYIKQDYPVIYENISKRVEEGKWEPDGGMWVEPDCNLPSGESFVRQLLHGTRFFRKEFGVECKYLWLPDVFGYSWALPQILRKSGLKTFVTTKISWNQYNRMPHDLFRWRGIDGTEILTYFITTPYPGRKGFGADYNSLMTAETTVGAWEVFKDKGITKDILVTYGYGDGGGGVNREMLEMRRRLNEVPGIPNVITGKVGAYFDQLHHQVEHTDDYVHTWDGELYLEYHRGTYTSQAYNKKSNRKMECLLQETEFLSVIGSVFRNNWSLYPSEKLSEAWKILLRNQFHDIIPGSSIHEVYVDSREEYRQAEELVTHSRDEIAQQVTGRSASRTFTVINMASWERNALVKIPVTPDCETGIWFGVKGERLPAEKAGNTWLVQTTVPKAGFISITFESKEENSVQDSLFHAENNKIITPYYEIEWNESGQLSRIYDIKAEREILQDNLCGNALQIFEDKPLRWDAWDIDIFYQEKMKEISSLKYLEVSEMNSIRAVIHFTWEYNQSLINQDMILYAHSRRIDFETKVDWHERHQLLKVAFPVEIRSTEATYDIQFGNVKRPTHWNTSWDYAKFETVGHQWADLSEQGYGISLLNDCKYGYDIKDSTIRLSLLRAATYPDYSQDQGEHTFTYSLLPHQGDWVEGSTVQEALDLNQPLSFFQGKVMDEGLSLFKISADYVMVDAVKKAEDSHQVILRLHEFTGQRGVVEIDSDVHISSWQETDLMERPIGPVEAAGKLTFPIKPYEIKTFLVDLKMK